MKIVMNTVLTTGNELSWEDTLTRIISVLKQNDINVLLEHTQFSPLYDGEAKLASSDDNEDSIEVNKMIRVEVVDSFRTAPIFRLWREREVDKLNMIHANIEDEIKREDENYSALLGCAESASEIINGKFGSDIPANLFVDSIIGTVEYATELEDLTADILLTDEAVKALAHNEQQHGKALERLHEKFEEIEALLLSCETYEQEMNILTTRKIVDTSGTIITNDSDSTAAVIF
jgi:phosphoheptose isomerase